MSVKFHFSATKEKWAKPNRSRLVLLLSHDSHVRVWSLHDHKHPSHLSACLPPHRACGKEPSVASLWWNTNGSCMNLCASKTVIRAIKWHQGFACIYIQLDNEHQSKSVSITDTWRVAQTVNGQYFRFVRNIEQPWQALQENAMLALSLWILPLDKGWVKLLIKKAFTNYSCNKSPTPFLNNSTQVLSALSILKITDLTTGS